MTGTPAETEDRHEPGARASDAELLRRYAATRAEDAFGEVVRRHLDGVYSAALRRLGGDAHLAQDVAQRVFVALARKAATVAQREIVTGWLYAVTRNEAANAVRTEQRRREREAEAMKMQDLTNGNEVDWSRVAPVLDAVVDELAEAERMAILLRFVDRRPFAEIGAALRVSEDAARMRVDRALGKLRGRLARRGVTSTAVALGLALGNHAVAAAPAGMVASVTGAAVAAAPAVAAPVAAAVQFMTTSKIMTGVAVMVLVGAMGTAIQAVRAQHGAEESLAAAQANHTALLAKVRKSEEAAVGAERKLAIAAEAQAAAARAATNAKAGSAGAAPVRVDVQSDLSARYPAVREAWIARSRATTMVQYRPFLREQQLTAAQSEEFARLKAMGTTIANYGGPDGKPLQLSADGDQRKGEEGLRALLGETGYARMKEFDAETRGWQMAADIAGSLYHTATPLTPEQAKQLVRILVNRGVTTAGMGTASVNWAAIVDDARGSLTAPQLTVLAGFQTEQQYQQTYVQAMQRAMVQGLSPAPVPTR